MTLFLQVKVKPKARQSSLEQQPDGTWLAHVQSPPVDGKANQELVRLVAAHFGCRQADMVIKRGALGRRKRLEVHLEHP